jgi:hypothetical protein
MHAIRLLSAAAIAVVALATVSSARAAATYPPHEAGHFFFNGNQLLEACDQNVGFCLGYVAGSVDALEAQAAAQNRSSCMPNNVTTRQLTDVVHNYLRVHAENRQGPAQLLMLYALSDAFPCARAAK